MQRKTINKKCAICYTEASPLYGCENGHVCGYCLEAGKAGRDETTKASRAMQKTLASQPDSVPMTGLCAPQSKRNEIITEKLAEMASTDAGAHRLELLDKLGTDCVALAVDSASSVLARNSHETMLCHQLAVAHKTALEIVDKGMLESDSVERARTLNVAVKLMDVFQRGLLALHRSRSGGEQRITIHHVSVGEGGQAIVGGVQSGGVGK